MAVGGRPGEGALVLPAPPYGDHAGRYWEAGWAGVLPLPVGEKSPPPRGYTGFTGRDPSQEQVDEWVRDRPASNIALRLPSGVVGIDVDDGYEKTFEALDEDGVPEERTRLAAGARTLRELEQQYGALPGTVRSSARWEQPGCEQSGIRLFRAPRLELNRLRTGFEDIELVHAGQRYVVSWPSVHPNGEVYRYLDERTGEFLDRPPRPEELAELPASWYGALTNEGRSSERRAVDGSFTGEALPQEADEPCPGMQQLLDRWRTKLLTTPGSRHDTTTRGVMALVAASYQAHHGLTAALAQLFVAFRVVAGADRQAAGQDITAEFQRMVDGARRVAAADPAAGAAFCPCDYRAAAGPGLLGVRPAPAPAAAAAPAASGAPGTAAAPAAAGVGAAAPPQPARAAGRTPNPLGYQRYDEAFWNPPRPSLLVPSVLVEGQVGVIYAPGGQGKSLVSQDIAIGLTCRGSVFGQPVDLRTVLYIDRENSARGLLKRMRAMGLSREHSELLRERLHYSLLGGWPPFDSEPGARVLLEEVDRLQPDLVVVDTLSKVVQGEENTNDTWNGLHSRSMIALKERGVSVLQLDHTGKDPSRGQRGGSAKLDNADVVWLLTAADPNVRLENKKDREGDYSPVLYLQRRRTPVLEHVLVPELSAAATAELAARSRVNSLVELLDREGCPVAGRPTVQAWLAEHHPELSTTKETVTDAVRVRKQRPTP